MSIRVVSSTKEKRGDDARVAKKANRNDSGASKKIGASKSNGDPHDDEVAKGKSARAASKAPEVEDDDDEGADDDSASSNGQPEGGLRKRRATAQSMAASQRDISVSEFFAKNRHLLGFDNPRKALLTTVKEAVDNSLDACEEAGILPEIWVHIEETGTNRFKVGIQDNGPGIVKAQIPNIFGKLLYGSKFHRLRQSRGQQGIGISAAGMYGVQTTGKPVKIISRTGAKKPAHYFELQIDTKKNKPEILNGKGEGVDIERGEAGQKFIEKHGIEWVEQDHGTRVTIELEAKYQRGRGSVDEYLEQTAISNPHVTIHYIDPENEQREYLRQTETLPAEPREIKPHPYGVELGRLAEMLKQTSEGTLSSFLTESFSRVSPLAAKKIVEDTKSKLTTRSRPNGIERKEVELLYQSIQNSKLPAPATDCIVPIGEDRILKGLRATVRGEFYAAATRPPAVYRGNPFVIEVGLAYGGSAPTENLSRELLDDLLNETDARTVRQFLISTFNGLGAEAADKIIKNSKVGTRQSPSKLKPKEVEALFGAMTSINISEDQSMNVLRYANRVPLQFQLSACAVTQTIMATNWRSYGLSQSRSALPRGPISVMVHVASVWVPFTSESKEAIASYPEIQKELRLGLQAVGRKLGMYLRRRLRVKNEGERRTLFLRYLGEVATAVSEINESDRKDLYDRLLKVAQKRTAEADVKLDERGKVITNEEEELELGENVIIVDPADASSSIRRVTPAQKEAAQKAAQKETAKESSSKKE